MTPPDVGRLTPFQVHSILLVERDKKGLVKLDSPPVADNEPCEISLLDEWGMHCVEIGMRDPDAIKRFSAVAVATEQLD